MKIKTHKASSKRFAKTGSGQIKQTKVGHQHLRRRKTSRMLQNAKGTKLTDSTNLKKIKRLLPYL